MNPKPLPNVKQNAAIVGVFSLANSNTSPFLHETRASGRISFMGHPLRYVFNSYHGWISLDLRGIWLQKVRRHLNTLSHTNTQHAVRNSGWQQLGPFLDRLVRNTNGLCGRGQIGPEQFDGL